MLDSDTKQKIDSLRNILVGKIPNPQSQVEQITTGLIYKFMHDMDQESIEMGGEGSFFVGDYKQYSWDNLFDTKLSGVDKVNLYSSAIEGMYLNPNAPELFRNIFKNAFLPFKDPSTLNMFLKEINEFHYSHSEKLGDAFEYLISIMGSQGDAGQFRTPRHIIDFIVEIINPQKHETVLDPACGTGGFLISSYKHILKTNTDKKLGDLLSASDRKKVGENIGGYDISPEMIKLSLVNMYLHGFSTPDIEEYDTLSSEDKWNEYYDVILANPPFFSPSGGIQPHKRFGVDSKKAEVLFTSYILEHLKPNGRAGIIVPEGIVYKDEIAYKKLRKFLIEDNLIGVISLPSGIFNPYSGVTTSILIIDKKLAKSNKEIFFCSIKNDGFDLGAQRLPIDANDIPNISKAIKSRMRGAQPNQLEYIEKDKILSSKDLSLSPFRYKEFDFSGCEYPIVSLGEVLNEKPMYGGGGKKSQYDGQIRVIRITDISEKGILNNSEIVSPSEYKEKHLLKFNDILIARSASVGRSYIHKEKNGKFIYAGYLIRFPLDTSKILPDYFFSITQSNFYKEWVIGMKKTGTISNINAQEYLKFKFPLPSLEIQKKLVDEIYLEQENIDLLKKSIEDTEKRVQQKIAKIWGD